MAAKSSKEPGRGEKGGKDKWGYQMDEKGHIWFGPSNSISPYTGSKALDIYAEKIESTGANVSGTIDSVKLLVEQLEQERTAPTIEDFARLKNQTTNLSSQFAALKSQTADFINFVKDETEILVTASLVKTIPNLEQRIKRLEEEANRKRNWRVNGWLLALTIISTAAAVWALFIR